MTRAIVLYVFGAALAAAALSSAALDTKIPEAGLPSASDYAASLLPELSGVVSWRTLSQVEPVKQGSKMIPQFSKDVLGLDKQQVRVQGFIIPLEMGDKQTHFLLSAVPPHCPFCMPAGPDSMVEVEARIPIAFGFEVIVLSGKFAVLKDDPAGMLYRMTDAEAVARPAK
ncbi:MAG: DUF3299 domain-containing protein [Betaproteobacteria bacterium]|nr:MAG: DUF3299 domain-containing protein [Betaproteobacteria bacterium]